MHNTVSNPYLCTVSDQASSIEVPLLTTHHSNLFTKMNAFRILALLLVLGISQAGATGFAYNMNKAQKMLKCKKEGEACRKAVRVETKLKLEVVRSESRVEELIERETRTTEEPASEHLVDTFTNWLSHVMVKLVSAGLGIRG